MRKTVVQWLSAGVFCLTALLSGCIEAPESTPVQPAAPPAAKAMLEDVAKTGELGSAEESIRQSLTELKATDAAKADALLKELDQLRALKDPGAVKAKAKAMADKL